MKKLAVLFVLVLALALSASAAEWTGYISDAACAAKSVAKAESADHAGCAAGCAKKGGDLVLVSGGKVMKIANRDKVADHAGHKVTVTGKLDGETITVDSVKM